MAKMIDKGAVLNPGDELRAGEAIFSPNRWYVLYFSPSDGNVVLYHRKKNTGAEEEDNGEALWATHSDRKQSDSGFSHKLIMQANDGHLVLYDKEKKPLWKTDVFGEENRNNSLRLQNDGNLVIYAKDGKTARWHTNTWNYRHWMGELNSDLKLTQVCVPGTHDSGMYYTKFTFERPVLCQDKNIYEQLVWGVRYINLRPRHNGSDFYVYHGPADGPKLKVILDDIKRFFEEGTAETLYLDISHFKDLGGKLDDNFVDLLFDTLGSHMVDNQEILSLKDTRLKDVRGKILLKMHNDSMYNNMSQKRKDRCATQLFYDDYANAVEYDEMFKDQKDKFEKYNDRYLCMLNWTLTPRIIDWGMLLGTFGLVGLTGEYYTYKNVSWLANSIRSRLLEEKTRKAFFGKNKYGKTLNIINVDYYDPHTVMKACQEINSIYS